MDRRVAAKERQLLHNRVAHVDGHIQDVLRHPEQHGRSREILLAREEIESEDRRQEDLRERAAEHVHELSEEDEDPVAGLVDEQVQTIYEIPIGIRMRRIAKGMRDEEPRENHSSGKLPVIDLSFHFFHLGANLIIQAKSAPFLKQ